MNITIIGGGNIGTLIAGQLSSIGHKITLYTRNTKNWSNNITVIDKDTNSTIKSKIYKITDDMSIAINNSDLIFITVPAFAIKDIVNKMLPFINKKKYIGFYPGTGGVEFIATPLINKGCVIFGTQRVCSVARLEKYGNTVVTAGKRKHMYICSIPLGEGEYIRKMFSNLFDIETSLLPNYLNVTLTPSNPILHTSRLSVIFKNYKDNKIYNRIPLFYEEWNDESSKKLIKCDEELHKILKKLHKIDTSNVMPLLNHYESYDEISLTNKIRSIKSFKGIETPNVKIGDGYIPDFNSRYFTADFPYGILIIKSFGIITNTKTPNIDKIIKWYQKLVNKNYIDEFGKLDVDSSYLSIPQNYGINTIEDIYDKYCQKIICK